MGAPEREIHPVFPRFQNFRLGQNPQLPALAHLIRASLNLLQDLQESKHLTYMFITHDMSVVRHLSDDICVMYLGQVVEICPAKKIFQTPLHPYTKVLLSAIPSTDLDNQPKRIFTRGELTSPINPKPGCRFAARCAYACDACLAPQKLEELEDGHFVACCRARELS